MREMAETEDHVFRNIEKRANVSKISILEISQEKRMGKRHGVNPPR
jgi:hypothetical protein